MKQLGGMSYRIPSGHLDTFQNFYGSIDFIKTGQVNKNITIWSHDLQYEMAPQINDRGSFLDVKKWPPVIILRRKMILLPDFIKNEQIYVKKNDPCRIMTPLSISVFILIIC